MQNELHHAEGWTKKNHKYIRKEGNRYIYPEDLKRISQQHANRQAAKNGKLVNPIATYRGEDGDTLRLHMKGAYAAPNQADYKQYSKEMSNQAKRKRAAGRENYKHDVVTSYNGEGAHKHKFSDQDFAKYTIAPKNSDRRKITNMDLARKNAERQEAKAQSHAKASNMSATEAKRISQQRSNRKAAANGAKEIYNFNGEPDFHVWGKSDQENAKRQGEYARRNRKQAKALNKQGSVNRQQESKSKNPSKPYVSDDYKKELEYNSKKNVYPEKIETEKIEVEKSDKDWSKENAKKKSSRTSKLKDRVSKAISNLKNKKSKKKNEKDGNQADQDQYYNGKADRNTLKNDKDRTYDSLIKNAKTKEEKKKWQKEKGRLIGTRHYTNEHGVEYDEDVYTNSKAASRGEKRLNWTDRGDGHPIDSWDKRGKMVQVAVKSGSDGGGWDVDEVTPENVKAKNYYNRKRKKN